jgi:hypothetical protein
VFSLVHVRGSAIALAAATLVVAVVAGAESGSSQTVSSADLGDDSPCKAGVPCTIVNGFAGEGEKGEQPGTFGEAAAQARPATACPEIARDYAVAGIEVDGFIGPCPSGVDMPSARVAAGIPASIGLTMGGSR